MTIKLPNHWRYESLGKCCTIVSGATPRRNVPEYWGNDIPWVTPKDISHLSGPILDDAPEYISTAGYKSCSASILPKGTVLFSSRAPIGLVALTGREMCTNQGFKSLIPGDDVQPNYLYHCMKWMASKIAAVGNGATFKEVSKEVISRVEIPLPPFQAQKRIADILDKADAIRRKRQQAIKLADEFLRATFLDMFGDPVVNPKGWEVEPLHQSLIESRNGLSRRAKNGDTRENIVLRLQDIQPNRIRFENPNRVSLNDNEKNRYELSKGDIAFIRVNGNKEYVGRSAVFTGYQESVYFNDHIIRLRFSDNYEPAFLSFVFNHPSGKWLISKHLKTSAGQYTISQKGIENINMIMPPKDIQVRFIDLWAKVSKYQLTQVRNNKQGENAFEALSQRAFRGEI